MAYREQLSKVCWQESLTCVFKFRPMSESNYLTVNKKLWNAKTEHHLDSAFYNMDAFLNGASSLNAIELGLLGDLSGKSVLHLQCHFGQDSLSLARMGAKVTGVDLSERAVEEANKLADQLDLDARFICHDLYSLPEHLDETFDLVFTSYGTITWLPDLDRWAAVVSRFLKPGGQFVFADFHPAMWMFDYDFSAVTFGYFNSGEIVETESGTYADQDADINLQSINWNHGLAETVSSLLRSGLSLNELQEFDYSPYDIFENGVEVTPGKYQVKDLEGKLPLVYALLMTK